MRLSKIENFSLNEAIKDINGKVYLFWSRTDEHKKWWDIDLLIINDWEKSNLELSLYVERIFFKNCEEKIDVIVFSKNMNKEENLFFNNINKICLKN